MVTHCPFFWTEKKCIIELVKEKCPDRRMKMITKERMDRLMKIFSLDAEIVEAALSLLIDQLSCPARQEKDFPGDQ